MARSWLLMFTLLLYRPVFTLSLDSGTAKVCGVFMLPEGGGQYTLNATAARDACRAHNAVLATMDHMRTALQCGLETCKYGWVDDKASQVILPRLTPRTQCGNNRTGLMPRMSKPHRPFAAFCFQESGPPMTTGGVLTTSSSTPPPPPSPPVSRVSETSQRAISADTSSTSSLGGTVGPGILDPAVTVSQPSGPGILDPAVTVSQPSGPGILDPAVTVSQPSGPGILDPAVTVSQPSGPHGSLELRSPLAVGLIVGLVVVIFLLLAILLVLLCRRRASKDPGNVGPVQSQGTNRRSAADRRTNQTVAPNVYCPMQDPGNVRPAAPQGANQGSAADSTHGNKDIYDNYEIIEDSDDYENVSDVPLHSLSAAEQTANQMEAPDDGYLPLQHGRAISIYEELKHSDDYENGAEQSTNPSVSLDDVYGPLPRGPSFSQSAGLKFV